MIEIREYRDEYAREMSDIILSNLYTINIADHGKDVIDSLAPLFTEDRIKADFPHRAKCFVALDDDVVVGTASIARFRGDTTGVKYIVLTVFVKQEHHKRGIGKMLIHAVEDFAANIGAKELVLFSSVYACEFYRSLGYDYLNGIKEQNEDKEYTLVKYF